MKETIRLASACGCRRINKPFQPKVFHFVEVSPRHEAECDRYAQLAGEPTDIGSIGIGETGMWPSMITRRRFQRPQVGEIGWRR